MARWAVVLGAFAAAASQGPRASAYCLTSACGEEVSHTQCSPAHADDCGEPLRWHTRCTGFSTQEDGSKGVSANTTNDLLQAAFQTWMDADCGGGERPGIVVQDLGRASCTQLEYNATDQRGNANIVVYREERWPHKSSSHNVALTTTTFDPVTGEIFDADMELNAANFEFSTGDEDATYDLESVLVHEAGHFLGVGHSDTVKATMFSVYAEGDTSLRSLDPDDVAAICDLYPPRKGLSETCNPLPPHGFSPDCGNLQIEGDCAVGVPGGARGSLASVAVLALAAYVGRRRRVATAPKAPATAPRACPSSSSAH